MSQDNLVSIVVPVYNVEKELEQCLDSLLSQTYRRLEIILVDDGSTDASGKICDACAEKDPRVQVIHKTNGGVSSARNVGMTKISGDYLLFVDADDWLKPQMVEILYQVMMNNPETDSVFCGFSLVNESGEDIQLTVAPLESGTIRIVDRDSGAAEVFGDYSTMPWNKFFRLKKRGALPLFDEGISLGEDELWELEMLKSARQIALIGDPLYFYRARSHSLSRDPALTPSRLSLLDSQEKVLRLVEAEYRSEPLIRLAQDRLYYKGQELMKEAYY